MQSLFYDLKMKVFLNVSEDFKHLMKIDALFCSDDATCFQIKNFFTLQFAHFNVMFSFKQISKSSCLLMNKKIFLECLLT
jgi:hypothetical protein